MTIKELIEKCLYSPLKFYIKHSPLELRYARLSFAQFGEDLVLENLLSKKDGFYVDVGAYHPFNFSNTYLFYRKGWSGINIEPNPYGNKLLRKFRKRDLNLAIGVSDKTGSTKFLSNRTYSRLLNECEADVEKGEVIEVEIRPLSSILDEVIPEQRGIDFLSIDCEGHDINVLKSNDWKKYRPKYVLAEDTQRLEDSEIVQFLRDVCYEPICVMGMTRLFEDRKSDGFQKSRTD